MFFEQTIASSVIEADQEASQSQIVISSENDLPGNYKLVMVTASNDNSTEEYMFSQSGTCKESLCCRLFFKADISYGMFKQNEVLMLNFVFLNS